MPESGLRKRQNNMLLPRETARSPGLKGNCAVWTARRSAVRADRKNQWTLKNRPALLHMVPPYTVSGNTHTELCCIYSEPKQIDRPGVPRSETFHKNQSTETGQSNPGILCGKYELPLHLKNAPDRPGNREAVSFQPGTALFWPQPAKKGGNRA